MATSVKMVSTVTPEKSVLITHETGWNNAKVYIGGKVVRTFSDVKELKEGISEEIEGFGSIKFKLHPTTLTPTIYLNGEKYTREKKQREQPKGITGLYVVFGILAFFNLLFFGLATLRYFESGWDTMRSFSLVIIIIGSVFMLVYFLTIIFLARGVYFFYFLGTGFFTLSTLYVCFISLQQSDLMIGLLFVLPRLIILVILGSYFKRMIQFMRTPSDETDVLDSGF